MEILNNTYSSDCSPGFCSILNRSSLQDVFCNKGALKISENSQENTSASVSFLTKLRARLATLLKKRLWHSCFYVNFAKFLKTRFL